MGSYKGYTLIEAMIAMAICAIAMTGIYETYHYQQKSYIKHGLAVDLQQNLRAGQHYITQDIRMAGYDPTGKAGSKITTATKANLIFDVDRDGSQALNDSPRETIQYCLTKDKDGNGIADGFPCNLGRQSNNAGGLQPVVENMEALEFCYTLEDGTITTAPADPSQIRSIFVSMLGRTANPVKGYKNDKTYTQASNNRDLIPEDKWASDNPSQPAWGPFHDGYKRKLLIVKVRCRNMGLKSRGVN
jgi:type IV pilus assembly protein PilW